MIEMTVTPIAAKQIKQKMAGQNLAVKLKYVTEGCGCVLSGVPTLELVNKDDLDIDDIQVGKKDMPIYMEKSKLIFYDDQLKIDFSPESNSFRLASPGQILNGRMSCHIV